MRQLSSIAIFMSLMTLGQYSLVSQAGRLPELQASIAAAQDQDSKKVVINAFKDAYLASDTEQGFGDAELRVGLADTVEYTSFFQFPIHAIEPGSTLLSASMRLYCRRVNQDLANKGQYQLSSLDGHWSEGGLTLSNQPNLVEPQSDVEISCEELGWQEFGGKDFTEMVRRVYDGEVENYGWALRGKPGADAPLLIFDSKETGRGFPLGVSIQLVIEYVSGANPVPTQGTIAATASVTVGPTAIVTTTLTPGPSASATPTMAATAVPTPTMVPEPGGIFLPIGLSRGVLGDDEDGEPIDVPAARFASKVR